MECERNTPCQLHRAFFCQPLTPLASVEKLLPAAKRFCDAAQPNDQALIKPQFCAKKPLLGWLTAHPNRRCENNVTFLPLLDYYHELHNRTYQVVGRYRVLGINYNNFTIRLVDEGIHKGNCSSLPIYSVPLPNITDYTSLYSANDQTGDRGVLFEQVGYLNCSDPVTKEAAYVDTSPCVNPESRGGGGHLYAVAGDLSADRFQPQCRLKWVTPIASDWEAWVPGGRNRSYADIHTLLSSGFELSWWQSACDALSCSDGYCNFSSENQSLLCTPW